MGMASAFAQGGVEQHRQAFTGQAQLLLRDRAIGRGVFRAQRTLGRVNARCNGDTATGFGPLHGIGRNGGALAQRGRGQGHQTLEILVIVQFLLVEHAAVPQ